MRSALLVLSAALTAATLLVGETQARTTTSDEQLSAAKQSAPSANSGVRRHNGRWWYQMPDHRWMVWQNNAWAPYRPGMFASDQTAAGRTMRRYSYDPGAQYYPRVFRAPAPSGASKSIRYAGSKANFDYAPYTGGSVQ